MLCTIRDIPIYYEAYGHGTPVLCLHGYTVDHRLMTGCLEPIFSQQQGYRRIYPDLPGMGKAPSAKWLRSADDMLTLIQEFIGEVIADERFLVIGESFGGYLALGLIHNLKQIDGMLLLCPATMSWRKEKRLPAKQVIWKADGLPADDPDLGSFLDIAAVATPEIFGKYKNDILSAIKVADMDFLYNYFDGSYSPAFEDAIKTVVFDKPACILTGRQDHVVGYLDAFELLGRFPRATYAAMDCAGHNLQIENEPLFIQLVKDWLWRVAQ